MVFTTFRKVQFNAYTIESEPCPRCGACSVLIAPTQNTHAASARCSSCGKFYRWLGKRELESLLVLQPHASKKPAKQSAEGNVKQVPGITAVSPTTHEVESAKG